MAVPKYTEFMKPLLEVIKDGQPYKNKQLHELLASYFNLNNDDKSQIIPSGKQQLYKNRIGWAKAYLKIAGLIKNTDHAVCLITDAGLSVLKDNPEIIDTKYLMRFSSYRQYVRSAEPESEIQDVSNRNLESTPQEQLDAAFETINKSLNVSLLAEIMNQSSDFFEKLVVDLVVSMGYGGSAEDAAKVVGKSGDEGIDGIIKADRLGLDRIYLQAKRWDPSKNISRSEIQKFVGALVGQGASKGIYITTAKFAETAREYAQKNLAQRVILIDGDLLTTLMVEHDVGVSVQETLIIRKIDSDYFEN